VAISPVGSLLPGDEGERRGQAKKRSTPPAKLAEIGNENHRFEAQASAVAQVGDHIAT